MHAPDACSLSRPVSLQAASPGAWSQGLDPGGSPRDRQLRQEQHQVEMTMLQQNRAACCFRSSHSRSVCSILPPQYRTADIRSVCSPPLCSLPASGDDAAVKCTNVECADWVPGSRTPAHLTVVRPQFYCEEGADRTETVHPTCKPEPLQISAGGQRLLSRPDAHWRVTRRAKVRQVPPHLTAEVKSKRTEQCKEQFVCVYGQNLLFVSSQRWVRLLA